MRQPIGVLNMTRIAEKVFQEKFMLLYSALVAALGLFMRSCHGVAEGVLLPLCTSQNSVSLLATNHMEHCTGCYVAAAGFVFAAVSVFRLAIAGRARNS